MRPCRSAIYEKNYTVKKTFLPHVEGFSLFMYIFHDFDFFHLLYQQYPPTYVHTACMLDQILVYSLGMGHSLEHTAMYRGD